MVSLAKSGAKHAENFLCLFIRGAEDKQLIFEMRQQCLRHLVIALSEKFVDFVVHEIVVFFLLKLVVRREIEGFPLDEFVVPN